MKALAVSLATATRAVGVALVPVLVAHLWRTSCTWRKFVLRVAIALPLSLGGLLSFILFQYIAFRQPFAFALAQRIRSCRQPASIDEKAFAFLSWEPLWSVYQPHSEAYWHNREPLAAAPLNLAAANPIYFVLGLVLIWNGYRKGWLNGKETLLGALLILVPYLTQGFEHCMLSQGRFVAAAFPIYVVLGQCLGKCPRFVAVALLCLSALIMLVYAAQFAEGLKVV